MNSYKLKVIISDLEGTDYGCYIVHSHSEERMYIELSDVIKDRKMILESYNLTQGIIRVFDISDNYILLRDAAMDQYSYPEKIRLNLIVKL